MTVDVNVEDEGKFVKIPRQEFERMVSTIDTLEDQDVLEQFKESEEDISQDKTVECKP